MEGQRHRSPLRRHVADRHVRSRARHVVLADRQPGPDYNGDDRLGDNLYTGSIVALDAEDGQAEVALPVHAARRVGLGCAAAAGAGGYGVARPAAQAAASGEPQRVLLCARSHQRALLSAKPFVEEADLGERDRTPTAGPSRSRPGARRARETGLPAVEGATNWYSTSFNPGDRSVLRADPRIVQHLHADARRVGGRGSGSRRLDARHRPSRRRRCCARSTCRPGGGVGAAAGRSREFLGRRAQTAGGSSSSARTAARSWPLTPRTGRRSGSFRPASSGTPRQ